MSNIETTISIREARKEDIGFIFNSWLKSFRNSPWAKPMHNNVYFTHHHALINDLLGCSKIYMACSKTNVNELYGYIVASRIQGVFTVHYVYVKHAFRNLGIANLLLSCFSKGENELGCFTHFTYHVSKHKLDEKNALLYNPYLLAQIGQDEVREGLLGAIEEKPIGMDLDRNIEHAFEVKQISETELDSIESAELAPEPDPLDKEINIDMLEPVLSQFDVEAEGGISGMDEHELEELRKYEAALANQG